MGDTIIASVRVDRDTKEQADKLFSSFGLSFSSAVNVFINQTLREGRIPFVIGESKPTRKTVKAMKEGDKILAHPEKHKGYGSVDDMFSDILK